MEPHPPLGKLLIAFGEELFNPNEGKNLKDFLIMDHVKSFPPGYSFVGVRMMPSLLAWLSAPLLFVLMYLLLRNANLALLSSSLYVFDNAFIVHFRGAMLEGVQVFFVIAALTLFVYLAEIKERISCFGYCLLGIFIGLAVAVKVNALVLILTFGFLFWFEMSKRFSNFLSHREEIGQELWKKGILFTLGIVAVLGVVWQIHFALGQRVLENRYYKASEQYKKVIADNGTSSLSNFPVMLKDNLYYFWDYEKGAPPWDPCKADENGSYPLSWLVGNKSINYRWEKAGTGAVKYLYLQGNPVIWGVALAGVLLSLVLTAGHYFFGTPLKDRRAFLYILCFLTLYVCYMAVMLRVTRVMYLYHYFLPLIFAFLLAALIFKYCFEEHLKNKSAWIWAGLILLLLEIYGAYLFYKGFTYYEPLSTQDFYRRVWFDFWKLKPII